MHYFFLFSLVSFSILSVNSKETDVVFVTPFLLMAKSFRFSISARYICNICNITQPFSFYNLISLVIKSLFSHIKHTQMHSYPDSCIPLSTTPFIWATPIKTFHYKTIFLVSLSPFSPVSSAWRQTRRPYFFVTTFS